MLQIHLNSDLKKEPSLKSRHFFTLLQYYFFVLLRALYLITKDWLKKRIANE